MAKNGIARLGARGALAIAMLAQAAPVFAQATLAWSGVATFVLLKVIGFFLPLRVRDEDERMGLDLSLHGEALQ
jgi:ammonia channel protein AmtB